MDVCQSIPSLDHHSKLFDNFHFCSLQTEIIIKILTRSALLILFQKSDDIARIVGKLWLTVSLIIRFLCKLRGDCGSHHIVQSLNFKVPT